MATLSASQIQELHDIAYSGQSGARIAYYSKLSEFGIGYGDIALGVVLQDQISGRTANAYFSTTAEDEGVSVSNQQKDAISEALMFRDLAARMSNSSMINGIEVYEEIDYEKIKTYHQSVYSNLGGTVPDGQGVSINAWSAYAVVEQFGTCTWNTLLTSSQAGQTTIGAVLLAGMYLAWFNAPVSEQTGNWSYIVTSNAFQTMFGASSPVQFGDSIKHAYISMGKNDSDVFNMINPAGYNKIITMGLDGDDDFTVGNNGSKMFFFDGGAGDDSFIVTGECDSTIVGGSGHDTLDFSSYSAGTSFEFTLVDEYNYSYVPKFSGVEEVIGSAYADEFVFKTVGHLTDVSEIDGGAGVDTLRLADDVSNLDMMLREVDLLANTLGNTVTLTNIENVTGGNVDDWIRGDDVVNVIMGDDGNDYIEGQGGNDTIGGGDGNDTLLGQDGNDYIKGDAGGVEGNDSIKGGSGNDGIEGGWGNDTLYGNSGSDIITGDGGNDVIFGGAGADIFMFNYGQDLVCDFEAGVDRIYKSSTTAPMISDHYGDALIGGGSNYMLLDGISLSQAQSLANSGLLWY